MEPLQVKNLHIGTSVSPGEPGNMSPEAKRMLLSVKSNLFGKTTNFMRMSGHEFMNSPEHKKSMRDFRKTMERRVSGFIDLAAIQQSIKSKSVLKDIDHISEEDKAPQLKISKTRKMKKVVIDPMLMQDQHDY